MIFFEPSHRAPTNVLKEMNKRITSSQTLELAARIRQFGIVPEFSFVFGNPVDPAGDTRDTIHFIRRIKNNPDAEIIVQHYIPTPHPDGMYGDVEGKIDFPKTPEEWVVSAWCQLHGPGTIRIFPWLPPDVKEQIDDFEFGSSTRVGPPFRIFNCRAGAATCCALSARGVTLWASINFRWSCCGPSVLFLYESRGWRAFECARP